ncbi:hypothetical protein [Streptomyces sp. NPDC056660]|uniref:hypothetical protein n=1 Tax=Streptomyces sp. NPDC056660 TaxID=3345897 RepID=UPI0036CD9DCD
MIESHMPDLREVPLHVLLDTNDTTLRHGLQQLAVQADNAPVPTAASSGGGGAERVD